MSKVRYMFPQHFYNKDNTVYTATGNIYQVSIPWLLRFTTRKNIDSLEIRNITIKTKDTTIITGCIFIHYRYNNLNINTITMVPWLKCFRRFDGVKCIERTMIDGGEDPIVKFYKWKS